VMGMGHSEPSARRMLAQTLQQGRQQRQRTRQAARPTHDS